MYVLVKPIQSKICTYDKRIAEALQNFLYFLQSTCSSISFSFFILLCIHQKSLS